MSTNQVYVGDTGTLTATVEPEDATDKPVKWSSTKPAALEIDEDTGAYRVIGTGTAVVTAAASDCVSQPIAFVCK